MLDKTHREIYLVGTVASDIFWLYIRHSGAFHHSGCSRNTRSEELDVEVIASTQFRPCCSSVSTLPHHHLQTTQNPNMASRATGYLAPAFRSGFRSPRTGFRASERRGMATDSSHSTQFGDMPWIVRTLFHSTPFAVAQSFPGHLSLYRVARSVPGQFWFQP